MEDKQEVTHRSGFVNIVGNPNVGKSTLMNLLVGERVSIITSKAQTTRHRIMGIVNTPELQIVYSDTPGVLRPNYKLQESMLEFSESALVSSSSQLRRCPPPRTTPTALRVLSSEMVLRAYFSSLLRRTKGCWTLTSAPMALGATISS